MRSTPVLRCAAGSALLAVAYYIAARLGLVLQLPGTNASPVWPPSGIALAALLVFGVRLWPGVLVGAFLANFLTLPFGTSGLLASIAIAIGNTVEQVTAWLLLRRLVGTQSFFNQVRSVFWLVVTAVFSCTVASTIGVIALWSTGIIRSPIYGTTWFTWWLGDTAGILVLAPALYFWLRQPVWNYSRPRLLEFIALAGVNAAVAELRFGAWLDSEIANSLPYLVVVGLMWAAFRFGPRETSTMAVLTAAIAIVHTWQHMAGGVAVQTGRIFAPFVSATLTPNQSMLMLQVFVCVVSVTALTLAAAIAERRLFEEELTETGARLRTIFEQAAVGVALIETASGRFVQINDRYCRLAGYTAEEMTRITSQEITHPEDLQQTLDNIRRMITGEIREFTMEKRYCRKDGSTVWVNLTASPTWGPNEKPEHHISVVEDITTRKQAEEALRRAHAKLQQLSREVIRVRDSERQHLARELHDEIGQNLAALRINMQLLRGAAPTTRIEDSIAIIDRILDEVRDLSLSLRPPLLKEEGITPALRSYFEEQSARSGLSIDFVSTAGGTSIPAETALALFRIAQEAMTNAIRHSQAKRVLVSLDHAEDQIRLIVQDNGIGIHTDFREEAGDRPKLGLQGIQERTALLGGEFTLRSQPGAGTSVCVQVPFKSAD